MTNAYYKISLDIRNHSSYISLKAKNGMTRSSIRKSQAMFTPKFEGGT